jgi:hypothetical protein
VVEANGIPAARILATLAGEAAARRLVDAARG